MHWLLIVLFVLFFVVFTKNDDSQSSRHLNNIKQTSSLRNDDGFYGFLPKWVSRKFWHREYKKPLVNRQTFYYWESNYDKWTNWTSCSPKDCTKSRFLKCKDNSWAENVTDFRFQKKCPVKFIYEKMSCSNIKQCDKKIILTEDQLLALPQKVNQNDAVHLCKKQGMNLIKVQNELNNKIVSNFAKIRGLTQYWMDGNDRQIEGRWVYEDGSRITYHNWHTGEPNNYNYEDCLHESSYGNGFWNDIKCDAHNAVICYRKESEIKSVTIEESQLVILPNKANYQDAVDLCKAKGLNLVKVQNEETNKMVFKFAKENNLDKYWMDGSDRQTEGQWTYENGEKITYSKWQSGEPNNYDNEDCLHGARFENDFWNDIKCDANYFVICYREKSEIKSETILTEDQLLALPQKANHKDAFLLCQKQGMNLIKVQNEQNNKIVSNFAKIRGLTQYWMDGNDREIEGRWVYEDGSRITYHKWHTEQPDNYNNEDCLHESALGNGFWNDVQCDTHNAVICYRKKSEIKNVKIKESQLVILPNKANYQDSVDFCKEKGLNLVKVQNEETNKMVFKFAKKNNLDQYWMDGSDRQTEGQWTYENGEKITYSKWRSGQPNNYNNEDCLHGSFFGNDYWNDYKCDANNSVICYPEK